MKLCTRCERKSKGLCRCGKRPAPGRTQCTECAESQRLYQRDRRSDAAERDKRRKRRAEQDAAVEAIAEQRAREAWL